LVKNIEVIKKGWSNGKKVELMEVIV